MGYCNNLEAGPGEAVNQTEGEAGEDKPAGVWGEKRPSLGSSGHSVHGYRQFGDEGAGHRQAALAYQSRATSASASAAG